MGSEILIEVGREGRRERGREGDKEEDKGGPGLDRRNLWDGK